MIIEVLIWSVRIFCCLVVGLGCGAAITGARRLLRQAPRGRHQAPAPPAALPHGRGVPDSSTGSMFWPEEEAYLIRRDGLVHISRDGEVDLAPWEVPHGAESGAIMWPHEELWNGHKFGCLAPNGDHHWTSCPEEGDLSDDDDPVPPLPDVLPAPAAVTEFVDTARALAADDPGNAGWTDQLLADLHDAPTVLDGMETANDIALGQIRRSIDRAADPLQAIRDYWSWTPEPSRLADTGEIALAAQRADYAAELRAQDDETTEYLSRLNTTAAELRLELHGL